MMKAFFGVLIIGLAGLSSACNQSQEKAQEVVGQNGLNESCDFAQFKPLKGSFDAHPNPNDRIGTPIYSDEARRAGVEGIVTMRVLVNAAGSVERVCVQTGDARLVKTSEEAVHKSTFAPVLLNDKPVPYVERTLSFNYVLSNERPNIVR